MIKVGDLVEVVKAHCVLSRAIGWRFTVLEMRGDKRLICHGCGRVYRTPNAVRGLGAKWTLRSYPSEWCKKIDPPSEFTKTERELTV